MGEIIVSFIIGGCLIISGISMNIILYREEKIIEREENNRE